MTLHPPHEKEQIRAIEINLATAPKIQEDIKAKFGYGENKFFDLDLFEYRINNSLLDIAEELDVKSLYGLINDQPKLSVGRAFRGHHDEEFMPDYQFEGLFSEEMNDMIEKSRKSKGGRKSGLKRMELLSDEERSELSRKANEAQGKHVWSLEEIVDIHNFREESIGKGRYKTLPCWNDTTSKMNEKYGENWSTNKVKIAYNNNKDKLSDEEE
jgi:hypothetical protein